MPKIKLMVKQDTYIYNVQLMFPKM